MSSFFWPTTASVADRCNLPGINHLNDYKPVYFVPFPRMHFGGDGRRMAFILLVVSVLVGLALAEGADQGAAQDSAHVRHKRGIFWDFFQKMVITKNLIVDVSILRVILES